MVTSDTRICGNEIYLASDPPTNTVCITKTATAYDQEGSPAQWTVTNACKYDGREGIWNLPVTISATTRAGFYAYREHVQFLQEGVEFSMRARNITVHWNDGEPGPFNPPFIAFNRPRELGIGVFMNRDYAGKPLNLLEPFQLYFFGKSVAEFP